MGASALAVLFFTAVWGGVGIVLPFFVPKGPNRGMGVDYPIVIGFTVFWGIIGIILPFFAPKGPNRGILQLVLMLTAATCWLFWLCCYMAQMNPLIGPKLDNKTILIISKEWDSNPLE